MIDYQLLAQKKSDAARRIKAALYKIRKQNIPRLEQSILEKLAECVNPVTAYRADRDTTLPFGHPQRLQTHYRSKRSVLFYEAHQAVILYWQLVRTDEVIGLERLVARLEYYAEEGYVGCELLGGERDGYTLLLPPIWRKTDALHPYKQ